MDNVTIKKGNLIKTALENPGTIDVIVHGCNCFCTMGSGFAKQVVEFFPEAYEADKMTKSGDKRKLGTYSFYKYSIDNKPLTIVNAYTQYNYGRDGCLFNYSSFEKLVKQFNEDFKGLTVGMPWIGCGLAGGDKSKVLEILQKNVKSYECIIFEL